MAGVVFAVVLTLTLIRSMLVVDAVTSPPGTCSRFVARATQAVSVRAPAGVAQGRSAALPRQQVPAGSSTIRTLHNRLLAMHLAAATSIMAGAVEYVLPLSDTSCRVAGAVMVGTILLYDASLMLFLLAKTSVTNGNRTLSRWETCITWWARFYAWVYLPTSAVFVGATLPGSVNDEGTHCLSGSRGEGESPEFSDTIGFMANNVMLIIQFVLLLAMFVKPMRIPQGSTQSGGAMYHRVVVRNVVCTAGIVFSYTVTTLAVVLSWLSESIEAEQAQSITDVTPAVNMFLTLCLTEIALPLGFSSCFKSVMAVRHPATNQTRQPLQSAMTMKTFAKTTNQTRQPLQSAMTMKTLAKTATVPTCSALKQQPTRCAVVPTEEQVP